VNIRLQPGADDALRDVVSQLNQRFALDEYPTRPVQLPVYADVASLPNAADWEGGLVFCRDVGSTTPGLAYSDGTNWRRADTNATL
jgi:hypothetical protein